MAHHRPLLTEGLHDHAERHDDGKGQGVSGQHLVEAIAVGQSTTEEYAHAVPGAEYGGLDRRDAGPGMVGGIALHHCAKAHKQPQRAGTEHHHKRKCHPPVGGLRVTQQGHHRHTAKHHHGARSSNGPHQQCSTHGPDEGAASLKHGDDAGQSATPVQPLLCHDGDEPHPGDERGLQTHQAHHGESASRGLPEGACPHSKLIHE